MLSVDAILDIGKTNIKLSLFPTDAEESVEVRKLANRSMQYDAYLAFDTERTWSWFIDTMAQLSADYNIDRLTVCTHGATAALVDDQGLVFAIADYEDRRFESLGKVYPRPDFAETYSPGLPSGLNLGRSIHWLAQHEPERFARVQSILMYPQYWIWRLTGVACSEVTSLGCHTDLWNPLLGDFSSLVDECRWRDKFPPLVKAGALVGRLDPVLATTAQLNSACRVFNGIHDSNASLVPYILDARGSAVVLSTGTWFILAKLGGVADLTDSGEFFTGHIDEARDMLLNSNFNGEPVPSSRFMGGREWQLINPSGNIDGSWADVARLIDLELSLNPCFAETGGPFPAEVGLVELANRALTEVERSAAATLYIALMTDYCLSQLGPVQTLYIEGPASQNRLFIELLGSLQTDLKIVASLGTGTSTGLLRLMRGQQGQTRSPEPLPEHGARDDTDLLGYRARWRADRIAAEKA
ncbi:FGGY-family carbohydrate kinase [Reinekea sp.]|uniref:FGGY-family carbohydrate kinase n=1 Tax=Reinekea sp. TaxID=1970455 RepID=UPI002A827BD4|nr:FGGY family carbohydrate kinase [Reinekea sp.]